MKPFTFERSLSKQDLGDMYEQMFIETMEGIALQFELSRKQESEHFPSYVIVKAVMVNASEFKTNGRMAEDITSLRVLLDKEGVFDDINAQQGTKKLLVDDAARTRIATELLKNGSHPVTTKDGTVFMLIIRPDHIVDANRYLSAMAGLDPKDMPPALLDLESLQNMHMIRQIGDQAYSAAAAWLANTAAPKLLKLWPEGEEREMRANHIDALTSTTAADINRALRFEQLINACTHTKGDAAVQQYVDALMFHAMAHGGSMDMVTGKLMDVPNMALRQLRQAFAVHQHKLENADPAVARIAQLISDVGEADKDEALDLFGQPIERLLEVGYGMEMATTLHRADKSFAERKDVQKYIAVLNEAVSPDTLTDFKQVVPFLFHYLEQRAPEMAPYTGLRVAISRVFNATAGAEQHVYIDNIATKISGSTMIEVQAYALAQHYLEVTQRLMPSVFPGLAPIRGQETGRRLATFKQLMNTHRPVAQAGILHS